MKRLSAIVAVLVLAGSMSLAGPRTWTSSNGRFSVEAELVDVEDGKAQLKKSDGQVIGVPLLSLSAADREHVKRQFPGVAEEQFRPGAEYRNWKSGRVALSAAGDEFGCHGLARVFRIGACSIALPDISPRRSLPSTHPIGKVGTVPPVTH